MNREYQEALDFLYSFVNFEHRQLDQYAPENISLERPAQLLSYLGNPHFTFPSVLIAGTKGKGSVAASCAACLRAAGFDVGLYTSPHLQGFRDRIRIVSPDNGDGRISRDRVVELVDTLRPLVPRVPGVTWYELVTAMAFCYFAQENVDVAVVEVGMGGRLDATNLLNPLVSVITSISFDHTHFLGNTLEEIAGEKWGIIKPGVPFITARQRPEVLDRLSLIAAQRHAPMTIIGRDWDCAHEQLLADDRQRPYRWRREITVTLSPAGSFISSGHSFDLALAGRHQRENALVTLATLDTIHLNFPELTLEAIQMGLANVVWPGRLQTLVHGDALPTILLDCAHNVDSAEKLACALSHDYYRRRLWLVLGATVDKDVAGILRTLAPLADHIILTASSHPRACDPAELVRLATDLGFEAHACASVRDAVMEAWRASLPQDLICVTGSIFVVGDLLNQWDGLQSHLSAVEPQQTVFSSPLVSQGRQLNAEH